jgi:hypothetical protein
LCATVIFIFIANFLFSWSSDTAHASAFPTSSTFTSSTFSSFSPLSLYVSTIFASFRNLYLPKPFFLIFLLFSSFILCFVFVICSCVQTVRRDVRFEVTLVETVKTTALWDVSLLSQCTDISEEPSASLIRVMLMKAEGFSEMLIHIYQTK